MKILYLHQYFNTPEMSGGTRSYEMARRFVSAGHEVDVVTSCRDGASHKDWFKTDVEGINVHWLPVKYSNKMKFSERLMAFLSFAVRSSKKASSIHADIIIATSTPLTIALPAVYASRKLKVPMVFEVRDLWPELPIAMGALRSPITKFLAKKLEMFAYKNSSSIVALSPGMKDGVVRSGFPASNIAVIPNSCDISMFSVKSKIGKDFRSVRNISMDTPLIVYTGTFGLINGVDYLVHLAVKLREISSDIKILAIGGGMEFELVKKLAIEHDVLNKNLFLEGYLKKKDIPAALSAATITSALFINKPEMRANSANKFFDSLAAGKPIMINYGGWMHDLVNSNCCGLSMWNKELSSVALELDAKLKDKTWLEVSCGNAKILANKAFDRDVLAKQYLQVLSSTLEGLHNSVCKIAPGNY